MAGRGILIAAGGAIPLTNTYVALHMLRHVHNCSLPVQIYYNGTSEMDAGTKSLLEVGATYPKRCRTSRTVNGSESLACAKELYYVVCLERHLPRSSQG